MNTKQKFLNEHAEAFKAQIIRCANRITIRHYESQPLPKDYSKLANYLRGTPTPSVMQLAFIKAVTH
jgi:hypothetical protein